MTADHSPLFSKSKKSLRLLGLLIVLVSLFFCAKDKLFAEKGLGMLNEKRLEGLVEAPDFPEGLQWLNTDHPIRLSDLKGKVVLLDFWTYCCINCMHVIPDLKKLEAKYPNELVVIGVHSAKFANEKGTDSIRQAILRYGIKHPVINDKDFEVWNAYSVSSWPTLVLINPVGRVVGVHSGEGAFEVFDSPIHETIDYFDKKNILNHKPLNLSLEEKKSADTFLSFPGKISTDASSNQIFITDSNHHRILAAEPEGKVLEVIGFGNLGAKDGSFETAEFNQPQGTALDGNFLYIADTENHLIRRADLKSRQVTTLWGTGEQAKQFHQGGKGTSAALSSPWDLLVHDGKLYVAMAGFHQLWVGDLQTLEIKPYSGTGREARIDGPLNDSALAQPSGITTDGQKLYFADSEVSSVRSADLNPAGIVDTLIGEDLFVFGDVDGERSTARLQHPLGVAYDQGLVYVADTYNSKIKVIDPLKKTSTTYAGTGKHGSENGSLLASSFFEPAGLAILGDKIYVADTNNHLIRMIDRKSGVVSTLTPSLGEIKKQKPTKSLQKTRTLSPVKLGIGKVQLNLIFDLPPTHHWTDKAPFYFSWKSKDSAIIQFEGPSEISVEKLSFPIQIPLKTLAGNSDLEIDAALYYCRNDSTLCLFESVHLIIPVLAETSRSTNQEIHVPLEPKK